MKNQKNQPMLLLNTPLTTFGESSIQELTEKLDSGQLLWLSGYFYGLSATKQNGVQPVVLEKKANLETANITILYGSQSGNSKKLAEKMAISFKNVGHEAKAVDMADYPSKLLKTEKILLIAISTYGEGEPPASAEDFYQFLHSNRAPQLPDLQFGVIGLGDRSYLKFCQTAIDFDEKLAHLGAKRLLPRLDCDVDYHNDSEKWIADFHLILANKSESSQVMASVAGTEILPQKKPVFDRKNPFEAQILEKIQLNGRGSAKETWHLELSLEGSGLAYQPGDALSIYACNGEKIVADVLKSRDLDPTTLIDFEGEKATFGETLLNKLELTVLTRDVLERYQKFTQNEKLQHLLKDQTQLQKYLWGHDVADLLVDFPAQDKEALILNFTQIFRKISPRAYSIASSLLAHPEEVHLTVAAVRYETQNRHKTGQCSIFLADRVEKEQKVKVFVEENQFFKLPKDTSKPIIMVGAGTGVAPFRAFVEERAETGSDGKSWLFFGNPNFTTDFLYQTEWQRYLKKGNLTHLNVAFSRDQNEKIYVQHRLLEQSKNIYHWLEEGAYFYVCGDKNHMAGDVAAALVQIVRKEAAISNEKAIEYVKNLKKRRQYLEDVY
jgi:sulfite reductase (NADPH) flavoprotein alpha-component